MILKTNQLAVHEINKHCPFQKSSRYNKWNKVNFEETNKIVWNFFYGGLWGSQQLSTTEVLMIYIASVVVCELCPKQFQIILFFLAFCQQWKWKMQQGVQLNCWITKWVSSMSLKKTVNHNVLARQTFFRQYIKNKRNKYGVKFYQIWPIWHFSKDDYNLGQTGAIVMNPMDGYL